MYATKCIFCKHKAVICHKLTKVSCMEQNSLEVAIESNNITTAIPTTVRGNNPHFEVEYL